MNSLKPRNPFLVHNCLNLLNQQAHYASSGQASKIKIPNYIPRGKTEILEALASTVKPVPQVLPYIYFHDPYLSPRNVREAKNYALSRESGVKAANYFMKNYPELFYRDQAEPKVEALSYPDVFNSDMEFSLDDIRSSIEKRNVSNTICAYQKLNEQQADIPAELRLQVFELTCFFNSKDPFEYVEELPFSRKITANLANFSKLWDETGFAEQMWTTHYRQANDVRANTVYLQALVKYGAFEKAYRIHQELEGKKQKVNLEAYNALLRALPFVGLLNHSCANVCKILELINSNGYGPTIETINSALFSLSQVNGEQHEVVRLADQLFLDCKQLGLPANLGSYYYMLNLYYRDQQQDGSILCRIIDKIENTPIRLSSKEDLVFFDEAMRVCANYNQDYKLAIRIFEIFRKHDSMYLNVFRESNIYETFFIALAKSAPTNLVFQYYEDLCPGIFYPSPLLFTTLVDHLIVFNGVDHLEKFFAELNKYSYENLNNLNNRIFHLMVSVPRSEWSDRLFADFMMKSMERFAQSQLRMDREKAIGRNMESLNALLDHMILLDREQQVADFITKYGLDLQPVEPRNIKKFYSKLLRKLIGSEQASGAIKLLRLCAAKETGPLDQDLLVLVDKSNLREKDKQMIKNLLILC